MANPEPLAQLIDLFSHVAAKKARIRRIPISGANQADVSAMITYTDNMFKLFASALEAKLGKLNENLPITETVDARDIFDGLADLNSDLCGRLMKLYDKGD